MNPKLPLIPVIALLIAGCAAQPEPERHQSRAASYHEKAARDHEEGDRPPRIGMTKDQVLNQYGRPVNVSSSSRRGEVWSYVFNNMDGRDFIPYYGAFHAAFKQRHSGSITFDASGRVSDFQWNESNPAGGTVWR